MTKVGFGEKIANFDKQELKFIDIKADASMMTFRLIDSGCYDAKHFKQLAEVDEKTGKPKWDITYCSRIMDNNHCDLCEQMFEILTPAKEMRAKLKALKGKTYATPEEAGFAKSEIESLEKELQAVKDMAKPYSPSVTFYYPIINRATHEFMVWKTSPSIRWKLDELFKSGFNLLAIDLLAKNTGKQGADKYQVTPAPQTTELTEAEVQAYQQAKALDLDKILTTRDSEQEVGHAEEKEEKEEKKAEPTDIETAPDMEF